MDVEEWRPVVGFESSYEVSSKGAVRSIGRIVTGRPGVTYWKPGAYKSLTVSSVGYPMTTLYSGKDRKWATVHTLVAEAFLGPRPPRADIRHLDGDKLNNCVSNLQYGSRSENLRDAVKHGTNWNTAKTSCPRGHPYSGRNLKFADQSKRHRLCRACTQERTQAHREGRPFSPGKADEVFARHLEKEDTNG